jgi:predicted SnoaL-like aldol condensation-catalyzing enzyme
MSTIAENKELVIRYLEAISGKPKPESLLREYLEDEELIEHILASEISFPEYELNVEDILAEGDLVAVRARLVGTHQEPFMDLPPTGRKIDLEFFINYRIAHDKIVDHWMILDSAELMKQLGVELVKVTT